MMKWLTFRGLWNHTGEAILCSIATLAQLHHPVESLFWWVIVSLAHLTARWIVLGDGSVKETLESQCFCYFERAPGIPTDHHHLLVLVPTPTEMDSIHRDDSVKHHRMNCPGMNCPVVVGEKMG
jgi:hypothetical protein